MSTKHYVFTGPVRWAKVWPGQCDRKFAAGNPSGGNWSVVMTLSDEQAKLYNALGLKGKAATKSDVAIAQIKAEEKGRTSDLQVNDVSFKRYERHAKLGELGSPAVLGVEDGTAIGNGSVCAADVEVYTYPAPDGTTGSASRLVSLQVVDLVEYEKPVKAAAADTDGPPVH